MANENGIVYQNKDVMSKHFGEHLKEKSLEVYGFRNIPKIVDVRPTNLPVVEANELRIDNLFIFEDESIGIIDYESEYKHENIVKYLGYVARIVKRWFDEFGYLPRIRILIIYTADVKPGSTPGRYDLGGVSIQLHEGFLLGLDGKTIHADIDKKITTNEKLTEEDVMKLVISPLTFGKREDKQEAVSDAAQLADAIKDEKMRTMALAGILVFADKIITDRDADIIRRRLSMTKIEAIYEREKQEAVDAAVRENTRKVTQQVTRQVTRQVTFDIIFDLVASGDLAREAAMQRVGLSDDEFGKKFDEYRKTHAADVGEH